MLSQVWFYWVVVISKENIHLALSCSQITNLSLIIQALPHNLNQSYDDSSKQSIRSVCVKEIEVPKDVGDMLESWLNKAKKVGDVRYNITVVEPSGGTSGSKKIMISNLNHEKIRRTEAAIVELMELSDSSDSELDENILNWLLIKEVEVWKFFHEYFQVVIIVVIHILFGHAEAL